MINGDSGRLNGRIFALSVNNHVPIGYRLFRDKPEQMQGIDLFVVSDPRLGSSKLWHSESDTWLPCSNRRIGVAEMWTKYSSDNEQIDILTDPLGSPSNNEISILLSNFLDWSSPRNGNRFPVENHVHDPL